MRIRNLILADLVNMDNPVIVFAEVKNIIVQMNRKFKFGRLDKTFADTVNLFKGLYPGYRQCTTQYHDLRHTTDVLLALARMIHGAHITGIRFDDNAVELVLSSALLHDSGYIQTTEDTSGTGGKYTLTHVERGIGFVSRYFAANGYQLKEYEICRDFIRCTNHAESIAAIDFDSPEHEMLGKMAGTADLLGQFADRIYLEKLLFLYREFKEANLVGYESELDLLKKTVYFYENAKKRMAIDLGNMHKFMKHHFFMRWNNDNDLYMTTVESNLAYLGNIITNHQKDYREKLKRAGLLSKLIVQEASERDSAPVIFTAAPKISSPWP